MKKELRMQGLPTPALTRVEMDKKMHVRAIANFMMVFGIWGDGPEGECFTVGLGDRLWTRRYFILPKQQGRESGAFSLT